MAASGNDDHAVLGRSNYILKSWFRQKIGRQEFDVEARKLLNADTVHLHNQFLLALLTKCQALGSALVTNDSSSSQQQSTSPARTNKKLKSSLKSKSTSSVPCSGTKVAFQHRLVPANPLVHARQIQLQQPDQEEKPTAYACREMLLPDLGMIHGRLIVAAWSFGLDDVTDNASKMLLHAVEVELKTIISAAIGRRTGYKIRDKRFRYALGAETSSLSVRNSTMMEDLDTESEPTSFSSKGSHIPSIRPSVETGQRDTALQLACAQVHPPTRFALTLFDLFDGLQVHRSAVPSHTVYASNMERIINRLWHRSSEETSHEYSHKQLHKTHDTLKT